MGRSDEPTIVIEERGIEAGNKIIANLGKINFFGQKRSFKMVRLAEAVSAGKSSIKVDVSSTTLYKTGDGTLDLVKGDVIALAATGFEYNTGEKFTVESMTLNTEKTIATIKFSGTTEFYHYGRATSTGDLYNGVDMRGEVLVFSRNVKIIGEEID